MINYVSTKKEYLVKYLNNVRVIDSIDIIFDGEVIGRKIYGEDNGVSIEIDQYFNFNKLCVIRTNDENYIPPKGIIKTTNIFDHENIVNGLVRVTNFTLEGTDGIGKSTAINDLLNEGIVCFDRNLDVICKYMLFDVPMKKRISEYKKYLENTKDRILFLVNRDEEELRRRINQREHISEFDKYAVEYNRMYYDTYKELEQRNWLYDKLFLLDCTGLTIDEQNNKIKEIVLR